MGGSRSPGPSRAWRTARSTLSAISVAVAPAMKSSSGSLIPVSIGDAPATHRELSRGTVPRTHRGDEPRSPLRELNRCPSPRRGRAPPWCPPLRGAVSPERVGAVEAPPDGTGRGRGRTRREQLADPTAHAELEALRAAAATLGGWRLDGCTLVVTLEPCPMCAGALVQSRVAALVFGADDPKAGAVTSLFDLVRDPRLPHRVEDLRGLLAADRAALLRPLVALEPAHPLLGLGAEDPVDAVGGP